MSSVTYWITQFAVAVSAAAAVLEAGKKRFDLFGMLLIAFAAGLGGGSVRDVLLDRPVFWVMDQVYLFVALGAGLVTFFAARWFTIPSRLFLIPDAAGLALYTVVGTKVALNMEVSWFVASFMGVVTGVMGGVLRDVLCNEEPLVFQGSLYATIAWAGSLLFILALSLGFEPGLTAIGTGVLIFVLRMLAIRWDLGLPKFRTR